MHKFYWTLLFIACLSACGGGGDGGSSSPEEQGTNTAPTITDPGSLSLLEGETTVATISAGDAAERHSLTFSTNSNFDGVCLPSRLKARSPLPLRLILKRPATRIPTTLRVRSSSVRSAL